jgi:hypothetical protein
MVCRHARKCEYEWKNLIHCHTKEFKLRWKKEHSTKCFHAVKSYLLQNNTDTHSQGYEKNVNNVLIIYQKIVLVPHCHYIYLYNHHTHMCVQ